MTWQIAGSVVKYSLSKLITRGNGLGMPAFTRPLAALLLSAISLPACATLSSITDVYPSADLVVTLEPSYPPAHTATLTIQPTLTPIPSPTPSLEPTLTPSPKLPTYGPLIIGHSVAGRPIEVFRFGSGSRKLMIIAGMHGGYEWNTIALADQLILLLQGRPDWIPNDVTLFVLRSLNPDGEMRARGIQGRTNDNGVDLNRNWPANWKSEWPIDGCWRYLPVTAGPYPASEPETLALMQFLLDENIEGLINYHSAALGIFAGGQPPDELSLSLADAVASVSDYPYPPMDFGCLFTGQLIDWASIQGIAAIDIELTNHRDPDLKQNLGILHVFLRWRP